MREDRGDVDLFIGDTHVEITKEEWVKMMAYWSNQNPSMGVLKL
ncbi:MAG: hypothetical protein OXQ90_05320 [Gammaproteobacteria bacterium]|nr:hypothetical protein [Gammaproteobacteria bacterium]